MNLVNFKEESQYEAHLEVDRLECEHLKNLALFRVSLNGEGHSVVLTPNQVSKLVEILQAYILIK